MTARINAPGVGRGAGRVAWKYPKSICIPLHDTTAPSGPPWLQPLAVHVGEKRLERELERIGAIHRRPCQRFAQDLRPFVMRPPAFHETSVRVHDPVLRDLALVARTLRDAIVAPTGR